MKINTQNRRGRGAFTLIELLVVISIIAVLLALTVPAVFKAIGLGSQAQARAEIDGLGSAIGAFKADFNNVTYVPSRIRLSELNSTTPGGNWGSDALGRASVAYLKKMFGRSFNPSADYDWNGNGTATGVFELQGQECLVFFLGGIPAGGSPTGFSTGLNPTAAGGTRKGPYFDFKQVRLQATPNPNATGFLVYLDAFWNTSKNLWNPAGPVDPPGRGSRPYAYFSSRNAGNDYGATDCALLGVAPHVLPNGRFVNPNGFQIISAGPDGKFGPGGAWNPGTGETTPPPPPPPQFPDENHASWTRDNLANFSRGRLGTPQS